MSIETITKKKIKASELFADQLVHNLSKYKLIWNFLKVFLQQINTLFGKVVVIKHSNKKTYTQFFAPN